MLTTTTRVDREAHRDTDRRWLRWPGVGHELDSSGIDVDGDGSCWRRCTCGWETPPCADFRSAADALDQHVHELVPPSPQRPGRRHSDRS